MMKYKIMHRDSVIAEANGFEVTEMAEKPTNQFASSRGKNAV